jgi:hypothetical protein
LTAGGAGVGVTGGAMIDCSGNVYLYGGLGFMVGSPVGASFTFSLDDPSVGWNQGVQFAVGGAYQYGKDGKGTKFQEGGIGTPGVSVLWYYVVKFGEIGFGGPGSGSTGGSGGGGTGGGGIGTGNGGGAGTGSGGIGTGSDGGVGTGGSGNTGSHSGPGGGGAGGPSGPGGTNTGGPSGAYCLGARKCP